MFALLVLATLLVAFCLVVVWVAVWEAAHDPVPHHGALGTLVVIGVALSAVLGTLVENLL